MAYAPGIAQKGDRGRPTEQLSAGQPVSYFLQRHRTRRNPTRPHLDLRLGTPDLGLFSWAVPAGELPEGKQKRLAPQTEVHDYNYGPFEGKLGPGYGAGEVQLAERGDAVIHKVTPHSITFTLAHTRVPSRYMLVKMDTPKGNEWLLMQKNPKGSPEIGDKPSVRLIEAADMDAAIEQAKAIQEKIDGAHTVFDIGDRGDLEAYSIRPRTTGEPIVHTERLGLSGVSVPDLAKTRFRGEAFGVNSETGEAVPFKDFSGVMNASLIKALKLQKERKMALKVAPFRVTHFRGQDVGAASPDEQRAMLEQIAAALPKERVHLPRRAVTPEEKRQLVADIRAGKNPTTREGVILDTDKGQAKIKFRPDTTGYLRGTFPGAGRRADTAGGLLASLTPEGEPNIRLGTGFTDAELAEIIRNLPNGNLGRPVRINYQEKFPSGKLRAPSWGGFETDKAAAMPVPRTARIAALALSLMRPAQAAAQQPVNVSEYEIKPIVRWLASVLPDVRMPPPPRVNTAGYATNATMQVHNSLSKPVRFLVKGHTQNFTNYYAHLPPQVQRELDNSMATLALKTNGQTMPPLDLGVRIQEALPPILKNDAVATLYEKDPLAAAEMVRKMLAPKPVAPGFRKGGAIITKKELADAAASVERHPTRAQIDAGNYAKGHVRIQGLDITIENPKGSVRSGINGSGKKWSTKMQAHYGYIKRTESDADGDHVDVFIGPHPGWMTVFVVNQNKAGGGFDEHKVMLGYRSEAEARAGYLENYSKGWKGLGSIVSMSMSAFKDWLASGDTGRPAVRPGVKKAEEWLKSAIVRHEDGKWVLRTKDGKRVLGTHGSAEDAYKQEYAIQMSKQREKCGSMTKEVPMQVVSTTLNVPKAQFVAEVADTPDKRRAGLSKRAELPDGCGMFFDVPGPFWMKDVEFPLDLVHLTKSGEIVDIQTMMPAMVPDFMQHHYQSEHPLAAYAVELPGGWCAGRGVRPGDRIVIADQTKVAARDNSFNRADAVAATAAGALPAASLAQYHIKTRPNMAQKIRDAKVYTYKELEKRMRLGDIGVAGMGHTDNPALVHGSEIAGGNPLAHGFVVGKGGRVYHGGANYIPLYGVKGVRVQDIGRLREHATARGEHGTRAMLLAWKDAVRALKGVPMNDRLGVFNATMKARTGYYTRALDNMADAINAPTNRSGRGAQRAFNSYIERNLRDSTQRGRVTMLFRPEKPLTAAEQAFVHRQLTRDAPAYYSTGSAIRQGLKKVFLPSLPSAPLAAAERCRLSSSAGHQCGSLPAKILRGLGLTGRRGGTLPVEMWDNPNLKVVGMAGYGSKARALRHLSRVAGWRTGAGLAATGLAATAGGLTSRAVRGFMSRDKQ